MCCADASRESLQSLGGSLLVHLPIEAYRLFKEVLYIFNDSAYMICSKTVDNVSSLLSFVAGEDLL